MMQYSWDKIDIVFLLTGVKDVVNIAKTHEVYSYCTVCSATELYYRCFCCLFYVRTSTTTTDHTTSHVPQKRLPKLRAEGPKGSGDSDVTTT
jgi:hypothetical protein